MTKNNRKIKNQRLSSIGLIFLIDITLTAISFIASYVICIAIWPELSGQRILIQLPIIIAATSFIFLFIGYSKGVVKYDRTKEVYSIFNAICLTNILTIVLVVIHSKVVTNNEDSFLIPLSIIIVHSFLSFVALIASRFLFKTFHSSLLDSQLPLSRVLLGGSIKDAQILIEAFEQSSSTVGEYNIVGFVCLDKNIPNQTLLGSVRVINKDELNKQLLRDYNISQLIIAKHQNFDQKTSDFLIKISTLPLKIKVALTDCIRIEDKDTLKITAVDNLKVTDLYVQSGLEFENPKKEIAAYLNDKKILVIGAAGCVGSELVRKLGKYKSNSILLLDKADDSLFKLEQQLAAQKTTNMKTLLADILDRNRLENVFKEFSPDIVINAAGYKIFDFTKDNLYEATRLNILGNKLVSDLAVKHGVQKYVNLSRSFPIKYCSYARATERVGEIYLNCLDSESKTEFVNIRFGNVLESKSSVMNVFKRQLESGGPIKVSGKDASISFISVSELTELIIEATSLGRGGDIFKVQMGEPMKEIDLARRIIKLSQSKGAEHVEIVEAENLNVAEPMCLLASSKKAMETIPLDSNSKLEYIIEDKFDTKSIKNKINQLCVANFSFDKNITVLMDEILKYDSSSAQKHVKNETAKANFIEKKINPLAV